MAEPVLTHLELKGNYRSGRDVLLDDFYVPCLQEATNYDRAVGYFSSSLYHVASVAYSDFVQRDGKMRLICSPSIRLEDYDAMREGLDRRQAVDQAVVEELRHLLAAPRTVPATRLLATLVAANVLDVRVAFTEDPTGIFHDKLGVFEDLAGQRVSFVGSANETWAAWGLNHESFEVFASWRSEGELWRTRNHVDYFEKLWWGQEQGIQVNRLSDVARETLHEVAVDDMERALSAARRGWPAERTNTAQKSLMPHQKAVLADWEENDRHGIVAFATGAGKTVTAIEALRRWTSSGRPGLVLVPGEDLQRQWRDELSQELPTARVLVAGGDSNPSTWQPLLPIFTRAAGSTSPTPQIVLSTMKTFTNPEFLLRLTNGGRDLLIVADEMHRVGTPARLTALESLEPLATLGLSATFRRQFDEEGTERLVAFFGDVLDPVIGLLDAIQMGRLVPYNYRLHTVMLADEETVAYEEITQRIGRCAAMRSESDGMHDQLRMLLIQRSRMLKKARQKAPRAVAILRAEYREGDRWLVYCDDRQQLKDVVSACLLAGLPVMEYHSAMIGSRRSVLQSLVERGGIVVAIRCLDEGIDIPVCDHALILASSTVEREYVQRRGRVLRSAPDKTSATVHDMLLVDDQGGALTRSEAARALQFAQAARNPGARAQLRLLLAQSRDVRDLEMSFTETADEHEEDER